MLRSRPGYAAIGPKLFPWLVAAGLLLVGVALLYEARAGAAHPAGFDLDLPPPLAVTAGLVLQMALMKPAGFVIASAVLFVAVAYAFGSRRLALNGAIGLVLCAAHLRRVHARAGAGAAGRAARSAARLRLPGQPAERRLCGDGDARRARPRLRRRAHALQSALGAGRGHPRHGGRRAARHRPGADRRPAPAGHLHSTRPPPSSCSPASTTAPCTAARPPRSCSTRPASRRPS